MWIGSSLPLLPRLRSPSMKFAAFPPWKTSSPDLRSPLVKMNVARSAAATYAPAHAATSIAEMKRRIIAFPPRADVLDTNTPRVEQERDQERWSQSAAAVGSQTRYFVATALSPTSSAWTMNLFGAWPMKSNG